MKKQQAQAILSEAANFGYIGSALLLSPDGKKWGALLFCQVSQRRIPVWNAEAWKRVNHSKERLQAYQERLKVMSAMHKISYEARLLPN